MPTHDRSFEWPDGTQDATHLGSNWRSHALPQWTGLSLVAVARSFQEAAEAVFESLRVRSPDALYLPIQYLWRHHIELMLKANIDIWTRLPGSSVGSLAGHDLRQLHADFRELVEGIASGDDTRDVLSGEQALETLLRLEPHHDASRYPTSLDGQPYSRPERVDLIELRRAARAVSALLGGAYDQADAYLQNMSAGW